MEFTLLIAIFTALTVGIVLGLIGSGGTVLTVPVFVYLLGIHPVTATSYFLFVVGFSSLVGTFKNFSKGNIVIKSIIGF